ncbi:MAG: hypothetical protein O2923_02470 [Verrucomicrobia bacterium]|nr:hypothetical protein [Verrucomicrobiota bacterium]
MTSLMRFWCIAVVGLICAAPATAGGSAGLTNLRFKAISSTSNGIEILVGYSNGETNRFDLIGGTNLAAAGWSLISETNAIGATNCILLLDTNVLENVRYYEAWDAVADSDWDTLADGRELRIYGTLPSHTDSDADGMGDGWEIAYGFDPVVSNTGTGDGDTDGLIDRDEARYGTDPGNGDSDGDGTDDGDEVSQGSDPADDEDTGSNSRARTLVVTTDQSTSADELRFNLHRTGTPFSTTWPVPSQAGAQGNRSFVVVQGRHYLLKLLAEAALDPPPMSLAWNINPGSDVLVDESTSTINVPTVSDIVSGIVTTHQVDVEVDVDLQGFAAFRGAGNTMVPESEEAAPAGVLVTPSNDGLSPYLSNPREAKIIAKGFSDLDLEGAATRCLRFSSPSKIELVGGDYGSPTQPPSELDLGTISGVQFTSDVEFEVHMNSGNWSAGNYVDVEYVVKDAQGNDRGSDTVRLLGPVVMAIGDSVTMGFQRDIAHVHHTPPIGSGWSSSQSWSTYPGINDWNALTPPWNNANNRLSDSFQGFRGYLDLVLPVGTGQERASTDTVQPTWVTTAGRYSIPLVALTSMTGIHGPPCR